MHCTQNAENVIGYASLVNPKKGIFKIQSNNAWSVKDTKSNPDELSFHLFV